MSPHCVTTTFTADPHLSRRRLNVPAAYLSPFWQLHLVVIAANRRYNRPNRKLESASKTSKLTAIVYDLVPVLKQSVRMYYLLRCVFQILTKLK